MGASRIVGLRRTKVGPSQPERVLSVPAVTPTKEGAKLNHHRDRRPGLTPGPRCIWGPSFLSAAERGHSEHHGCPDAMEEEAERGRENLKPWEFFFKKTQHTPN